MVLQSPQSAYPLFTPLVTHPYAISYSNSKYVDIYNKMVQLSEASTTSWHLRYNHINHTLMAYRDKDIYFIPIPLQDLVNHGLYYTAYTVHTTTSTNIKATRVDYTNGDLYVLCPESVSQTVYRYDVNYTLSGICAIYNAASIVSYREDMLVPTNGDYFNIIHENWHYGVTKNPIGWSIYWWYFDPVYGHDHPEWRPYSVDIAYNSDGSIKNVYQLSGNNQMWVFPYDISTGTYGTRTGYWYANYVTNNMDIVVNNDFVIYAYNNILYIKAITGGLTNRQINIPGIIYISTPKSPSNKNVLITSTNTITDINTYDGTYNTISKPNVFRAVLPS